MPIPAIPATFRFVGARLRSFREARGWSREEVAVRVPCSTSTITAVELGYTIPSVDKAATICAAYAVRLDDVLEPVVDDESEAVAK
jgi:transcriptional regulator with XRE-family HTH domain